MKTAVTAAKYRDKLGSSYFQGPPDKQYFALRPTVVLEYAAVAQDGDQFSEALALEWYGINYWRGCEWLGGLACGVSFVSTLSDRATVDDFTTGLMFHIDNSYLFGVTRSFNDSDHTSVFITMDVLKAFESKQERFNVWKDKLKALQAEYQHD